MPEAFSAVLMLKMPLTVLPTALITLSPTSMTALANALKFMVPLFSILFTFSPTALSIATVFRDSAESPADALMVTLPLVTVKPVSLPTMSLSVKVAEPPETVNPMSLFVIPVLFNAAEPFVTVKPVSLFAIMPPVMVTVPPLTDMPVVLPVISLPFVRVTSPPLTFMPVTVLFVMSELSNETVPPVTFKAVSKPLILATSLIVKVSPAPVVMPLMPPVKAVMLFPLPAIVKEPFVISPRVWLTFSSSTSL